MSDMTIDEATQDTSVGGGELIPVSDAGSPKSMSIAQIKDYVLAQIAALTAASSVSVSDDSVYILKGGALKPVTAANLAAAIMNEAFGRAAVVGPNGNEVLAIKDSDARKTITFSALKTWLQDNMTVTPDLTLSTAGAAGTLGDSDLALVVQAASGKKVTLATLKDYVLGKLAAYVTAATAAQSVTSSDVLFIVQGGSVRKATVAQLVGLAGDVTGPATTTENNIPQWDSTAKKLKNGLALTNSINSSSTSSQIPSADVVYAAVNAKGDVFGPSTPTAGVIPKWDTTGKKLANGYSVVTEIDATGADTKVPTEQAVREAIAAAVNGVTPGNTYDWVFVPAAAMAPSKTNGATAETVEFSNVVRDVMSFGKTNDDACEFDLVLPDGWVRTTALKAKLVWTSVGTSAAANTNVKWGVGCVASTDGGGLSTAPDNYAYVEDMLSGVGYMQRTAATDGITPQGTTEAGGLLHFTIKRDNTNAPTSPLDEAALLLGVVVQFQRACVSEGWS